MIVKLNEHGLVVIPTGSIIFKGSRHFYWILLKEANLSYMHLQTVITTTKTILTTSNRVKRNKSTPLELSVFNYFNYFYNAAQQFNHNYYINTDGARYKLPCINGHRSRVLIREFSWARAVNARLLIMLVTRRHE